MTGAKPCPFCGRDDALSFETHEGTKWGFVECGCGARGPDTRTQYDTSEAAEWHADAIEEWNKRPGVALDGGKP